MKIVFLSTFYPFRGGIAQFNALLYREIEKKNEVEAITFKRQYPTLLFPGKTQMVSQKDIADPIPSRRWLDSINPLTYITTALKVKKLNADLILTKYWMSFFAPSLGFVLGMQSKKTKRIAILDNVIPHEKRFFDHAFNRYFLKRNDGFIAMSEKVQKDLLHYLPNAKCLLIPHPIYNQFGEKLSRNEALSKLGIENHSDKKILLFFGIIRDYKGLDLLLKSLPHLEESYFLVVAGEVYGSFEKYENIISELGIKNRIALFNNYIDDSEVKNFFSAADVCILPYKSATQSGITNISYHFELPIIATNVGGLAESIIHEKTGLIVDKVSENALANAIIGYFKNYDSAKMANEIKIMNQENSWENFAQRLLDFSQKLN
ncbi:MAG: glycosyltransferase [Bacteroidetes bacterium]|nr:glycosyltransferase [Bacteroidota bacterium]